MFIVRGSLQDIVFIFDSSTLTTYSNWLLMALTIVLEIFLSLTLSFDSYILGLCCLVHIAYKFYIKIYLYPIICVYSDSCYNYWFQVCARRWHSHFTCLLVTVNKVFFHPKSISFLVTMKGPPPSLVFQDFSFFGSQLNVIFRPYCWNILLNNSLL